MKPIQKDRIVFRIEPAKGLRNIPFIEFQSILFSFQKAFWAIGEYSARDKINKDLSLRRQMMKDYTLEIEAIEKGSLQVSMRVRENLDLFPSERPVNDFVNIKKIIKDIKKESQIKKLLPNDYQRREVLKHLRGIIPEEGIEKLYVDDNPIPKSFKNVVENLIPKSSKGLEKEEEIIGNILFLKLYPPMQFGIYHNNKLVKLPLTEELINVVVSNIDSIVKVSYLSEKEKHTGRTILDEVRDVTPLIGESFTADFLIFDNKKFIFKEPLEIEIRKEETYFLINKKLDIVSHGKDFNAAWLSFREDFGFLWEQIAEEQDNILDGKAKQMKKNLIELVKEVVKTNGNKVS